PAAGRLRRARDGDADIDGVPDRRLHGHADTHRVEHRHADADAGRLLHARPAAVHLHADTDADVRHAATVRDAHDVLRPAALRYGYSDGDADSHADAERHGDRHYNTLPARRLHPDRQRDAARTDADTDDAAVIDHNAANACATRNAGAHRDADRMPDHRVYRNARDGYPHADPVTGELGNADHLPHRPLHGDVHTDPVPCRPLHGDTDADAVCASPLRDENADRIANSNEHHLRDGEPNPHPDADGNADVDAVEHADAHPHAARAR